MKHISLQKNKWPDAVCVLHDNGKISKVHMAKNKITVLVGGHWRKKGVVSGLGLFEKLGNEVTDTLAAHLLTVEYLLVEKYDRPQQWCKRFSAPLYLSAQSCHRSFCALFIRACTRRLESHFIQGSLYERWFEDSEASSAPSQSSVLALLSLC